MKIKKTINSITYSLLIFFGMPNHAQIEPMICSICLSNLYDAQEDVITLACHSTHSFHISCLNNWFTKNPNSICPMCRIGHNQHGEANRDMHFASYKIEDRENAENCGCLTIFTDLLRVYE